MLRDPSPSLAARLPARFSRRRGVGAAAGALTLAALAACSGRGKSTRPARTSGSQQVKRGGVLSRWGSSWATGVDPHPQSPNLAIILLGIYQLLVARNPKTLEIEPQLAQKFEQPSPTEYVFHLNPAAKFQNKPPASGRPLIAADVVFSLNRVRTNDPRFVNRLLFDSVDTISAPDKSTVRITTKQPDVTTISAFAAYCAAIMAPEVVARANKFSTPEEAVGTGPFIVDTFDDQTATWSANKDDWQPGLPYLDGIHFFSMDLGSAWSAFLANQLQVAYPLSADATKPGKDYTVTWYLQTSLALLQPNLRRRPFTDARVTTALRLLVDHTEAINAWADAWWGRARLTSYIEASEQDWDFTDQEYLTKFLEYQQPKDNANKEAVSLLSAAGYAKENPLKFELLGNSPGSYQAAMSQLLQAQWKRNSGGIVDAGIKTTDNATSLALRAQGTFDYWANLIAPSDIWDPDSCFRTFYHSGGGRNYGAYSDPKLDDMIDRQRTLFDLSQRKAAVKEILVYMLDTAPYGGWCTYFNPMAVRNTVHNLPPEPNLYPWLYAYDRVWLG